MTEWPPIARIGIEVRGVNRQYSGLLDVDLRLSETPPVDWAQMFDHPPGVGIPMSMHPPTLQGSVVKITPPDSELETYLTHVDQRIDAVNRWYADNVWPQVSAAREQTEAEAADQTRRIEDARRRARDHESGAETANNPSVEGDGGKDD